MLITDDLEVYINGCHITSLWAFDFCGFEIKVNELCLEK